MTILLVEMRNLELVWVEPTKSSQKHQIWLCSFPGDQGPFEGFLKNNSNFPVHCFLKAKIKTDSGGYTHFKCYREFFRAFFLE